MGSSVLHRTALVSLVGYLLLSGGVAVADDLIDFYNLSLEQLGQIDVSIATGNGTPIDRAPATATVISAAEIEALGAHTLNDVIEAIPGVHVSLSTLSRMDSVYSIRGIHSGFNPHVLLLMNGVPVQFSLQGGRPSLFRLPVEFIARVEVIRGPGSAIYGADAYSGVINVITKDASAIDGLEMGGRAGSFGSKDIWLQGSDRWGRWDAVFNVAYQHSDGDKSRVVASDLQSVFDAQLGTDASRAPGALSTRYEIIDTHFSVSDEHWTVNLWSWISQDAGIGAGAAQALDFAGGDDSNLYMVDASYQSDSWFEHWEHNTRLSFLYYDLAAEFNLLPAGTLLPIGSDGNLDFASPVGLVLFSEGLIGQPGAETGDAQFDFVSIYNGWEKHSLRVAFGFREQILDSRERKNFGPGVIDGSVAVVDGSLQNVSDSSFVFVKDSSRTTHYLSLQDRWLIAADWELTAGVRYDDYSDFGATTNPRVALVWAAHERLTTKLLYGSAFRAPSFSEQFNANNPVSLGRADLDPEVIDTLELSFNLNLSSSIKTTLNLFSYQARDMIEFVPDEGATTKTAQNVRDQDGHGVEWEVDWKPSATTRIGANYSWQQAQDIDSGNYIADIPNRQFTFSGLWQFAPDWFLQSQINWVADRRRAAGDSREPVSDYTLADISVRRKDIIPQLDCALIVLNATDEDAREPSGGQIADDYPLESRSVTAELRYRFN